MVSSGLFYIGLPGPRQDNLPPLCKNYFPPIDNKYYTLYCSPPTYHSAIAKIFIESYGRPCASHNRLVYRNMRKTATMHFQILSFCVSDRSEKACGTRTYCSILARILGNTLGHGFRFSSHFKFKKTLRNSFLQ